MRIVLVKLELQEQTKALLRIAEALERMAPPLKAHDQMGRKSDISDLYQVDAATLQQIAEIEAEVAIAWDTEPGSQKYEEKKKVFEDAVRAEGELERPGGGQKAVDDLPWNRLKKKK